MISLRTSNIYREVLVAPFRDGEANELRIVSGFASPTMLGTHLADVLALGSSAQFSLKLVIGMSGKKSLPENAVSAFLGQQANNAKLVTEILVPKHELEVHSKIYLWALEGKPVLAWSGSANYTRMAFGLSEASDTRDEILFKVPVEAADEYVARVLSSTSPLSDGIQRAEVHTHSEIHNSYAEPRFDLPSSLPRSKFSICPLFNVRNGEVHNAGAGLNWGQPTESRVRKDRRAAYIPVPKSEKSIFPKVGEPFEAIFKDGQVLVLTLSQQGGKALTMPASNEGLGQFFRHILGIEGDRAVETSDLVNFESNCVVFEKVRPAQYVLHFYPGMDYWDLKGRVSI